LHGLVYFHRDQEKKRKAAESLEAYMMDGNAIRDQILRLLNVCKKLKDGDYLTSREERDVSLILGMPKFKDRKDMEARIDEFFVWVREMLGKK
jgi:hypothetical protein